MNKKEAKIISKIIESNSKESWQTIYENREYIAAWANGAKLELRSKRSGNTWSPEHSKEFLFNVDGIEFRIKPEVKEYRVALYNGEPIIINNNRDAILIAESPLFKEWLTPWMEYELSED